MIKEEPVTMKVFYSYASEDQTLRDQLEKHLGNLTRQGIITSWSNRNITAGEEWKKTIQTYLDEADIILLLISSDFISSDFCYSVELQNALKRQQTGEAEVLPILLRPVDWEHSSFSHLPVLPINAEPINTWPNLDKAFVEVVKGIKESVVRKYTRRGQQLLSKGQPEKALIVCEKALQINQTAHAAFAFQGDILLNYLNRPEEALAAYQEASKLEPTIVTYLMKIGDLLSNKAYDITTLSEYNRKQATLVAYQKASELEPTNASYLIKIGDLHLSKEALDAYRRASELEPTNASYLIKIGDTISGFTDNYLDSYEKALDAYRRASELEPTNVSCLIKMGGFLLYGLKRPKEALDAYRQASELEPTSASHHENIGSILWGLHRYEEAIIAFKQASELDPVEVSYHRSIGNILEDLHRYEEAIATYQKGSELNPTYAHFQEKIGDIYLNHFQSRRKALTAYQQASKIEPDEEKYYAKIGDVLLDLYENYEEATAAYQKAIECFDWEPTYYEKQAKALELWAKKLRNKARDVREERRQRGSDPH